MSEIKLTDYVAGGYFVVKDSSEGFNRSPLLPKRVISLSSCIGKKLEIVWGWNLEQHQSEASTFGIRTAKLEAFEEWSSDQTPRGITELETARHVISEFMSTTDDLLLLGAALNRDLIADFIKHVPAYSVDIEQSITDEGMTLGFEILGHFGSQFNCSWLCSGLEKDMNELFGIHPNQYGLIDTYAEAKQVYEWIAEDDMQGRRAEPEPYFPWLIVQYPVN